MPSDVIIIPYLKMLSKKQDMKRIKTYWNNNNENKKKKQLISYNDNSY